MSYHVRDLAGRRIEVAGSPADGGFVVVGDEHTTHTLSVDQARALAGRPRPAV